MALTTGADDAGLIDLSRGTMADYRQDLLGAMPDTQSVMTLVFRVNQNHLKSLTHSVADYEFKQVVDSKSHADYRRRVSDEETISMWQHLAIGAQTRCDRCMAVCPAFTQ